MENRAARRRAAAAARSARVSRQGGAGGTRGDARSAPSTTAAAGQAAVEATDPQALVVSHWFDTGDEGEPYSATIRLTGRRLGHGPLLKPEDSFVQEDRVEGIVPTGQPMTLSSWVYGIAAGEWNVTAELVGPDRGTAPPSSRATKAAVARPVGRADWSWRRWAVSSGQPGPVKTRWALLAPLARIPGVVPGSFTAMAVLSLIVAVGVLVGVAGRRSIPADQSLTVAILAILAGLIAAKVWYAVLKGGPWRETLMGGWAVDGFLVVAPLVAILLLIAFGLSVGVYLDAATPGIFFAVAIGRIGCFFTGCCAGRPTRSRFGIWSSDRRIGTRRIPTQLMESGAGLLLGVVTTLLVLGNVPGVPGLVFVAAMAVYFAVRQVLLRLRAESRQFSWRRSAASAGA